MKRLLVVLFMGTIVLSGCATLSKEECMTANWHQIGYEDGAQGYPDTRIASHREACAEYGISPDFKAYQDGHKEGVTRFCTARNGFAQGKQGYDYTGICPPSLEGDFLKGYQAGHEIHSVSSTLSNLRYEQSSNEREIKDLRSKITDKTNLMLSNETTIDNRYRLNQQISQMQQDLGGLEQRNKQLIADIARTQAKLSALENQSVHF
ncbi:DUF2799 domain-containing protein [Vibrio sp. MEBiC08052]|uniref:DUF2799 domain-containing protein n=1 Tax=Vibrio sp. MEBiC08052 TaxID=1761910 RepID=UPI0007407EA2|nr:DUF2799 domain-containing protein [Vibrio sp. MEBiC08052]KUI99534.1 hypothetical protein VRK_16180 [Vibrio sp. MEBiC08052]